ncbi:hypothetical protein RN001_000107 [Aquatica leii]|uniref:Anaphase-promoting complex subunit 4-like WD40 domain-containing protein n=1 Tax=Aquatica leii TaxID=1421715 RepID=A0AAN7PLV0_9COLE|nr:hypothetical protein RN001_000107 [Aquatica leii]
MNVNKLYCVYAGTVRGAIAYTESRANESIKFEFEDVEKSEITSMKWGRSEHEIVVGHRNGAVKLYNTISSKYVQNLEGLEGENTVVGIGVVDDNIVVGKRSGHINIWSKKNVEVFKQNLQDESTVECMVQNVNNSNIIATGGERNDLKLWDLENKTPIFKAKSMGHDELNLPIPTSVRGICFFLNENNLVSCATKEGHVLLYDERKQRRPVAKFLEPKASYTAIACAYKDRQCVVGTTRGYIQLIDLRMTKRCIRTYKSFTGGVTSLVCDESSPVVISTSLDRYLRIHDLETKDLLYKKYMKQSLTQLVMKPIFKEEPKEEDKKDNVHKMEENEDVDEEYEALFESMETITEKAKKRKHTNKEAKNVKLKKVK